ncbi:MAG: beta strand repeat-containing protein [Sphingosinicella sp.]
MTQRPSSLRLGCAIGATALALASPAYGQAFTATPATVSGTVVYDRATPGQETVSIRSNVAVIDWRPPVGAAAPSFIMLPNGTVATFNNALGNNPNFIVLNRILSPTNMAAIFNGTVISRLVDPLTGATTPGGTVLFSNPGGIIVGASALFDIGSLVLTSLGVVTPIVPGTGFDFVGGDKGPSTAITLIAGSRIVATAEGSWVILAAPIVTQGGLVRVNGSTALVAAEEAFVNINQGLFDILVRVGSANPIPITHTGTTGGPGSSGAAGDNHAINMVGWQKTTAIRVLLGGNVGYDLAAGVVNGEILISSGFQIAGGGFGAQSTLPLPAEIDATGGGNFLSDTRMRATHDIAMTGSPANPLAFAGSLAANSGQNIVSNGTATVAVTADLAAATAANLATINAGRDLLVQAGSINLANGTAGRDLTLNSGGAITVGVGRAGDDFRANAGGAFSGTTIAATGLGTDSEGGVGDFAGSNIQAAAAGALRMDDGDAARRLQVSSTASNVQSANRLRAATSVQANAAQNIAVQDVNAGTTLTLEAAGGTLVTDDLVAGGAIATTSGGATTIATANGGSVNVVAGGAAGLGTLAAATDLAVQANGITLADGRAGRDATLNSIGNLDVAFGQAGDDFQANAGGTFNVALVTPATINATGAGTDSEASAGALAGSNIVINANGNLRFDRSNSAGRTQLAAIAGSITATDVITAAARFEALAAGDFLMQNIARITAPLLNVTGGGQGLFRDLASTNATLVLGTQARFTGPVTGTNIAVTSASIDLAATGSIGNAATQLVTLNVQPTALQTIIGGTPGAVEPPGYNFSDAEAGRVTAATLRIQAPIVGAGAGRPPDVLVRDLSLTGTATPGGRTGAFELVTPGIVQVEGNLVLANAATPDSVSITATERLQIVTPVGSVRVLAANLMPGGTLTLRSNHIWSASQALLDQLRADPNFAGRDQALFTNSGPEARRGYIEADDVRLFPGLSLFVQNSGNAANFAGITVVQNTLTVTPAGAQSIAVQAFGNRINPDGTFFTNSNFFREVQFVPAAAGFRNDARFNLCVIVSGVCPAQNVDPGRDLSRDRLAETLLRLRRHRVQIDEPVDVSLTSDEVIEEPVTSGSDPVLWDCDRDDDGDCDEADRDGR